MVLVYSKLFIIAEIFIIYIVIVDRMASADAEAEAAEQQEIVKEYNIENDDPETLTKAREWDDWKDGRYLIDLCDILLCGSKGD